VLELADIFRAAAPAYRAAHGSRLLPSHRRALHDIVSCRTSALGGSLHACDACGALQYRYHSCRNRHCPKCQEDRAQLWLERVRARLLPCDHYLLTFTLPQELRPIARAHQKPVYALLLREAAAAVQTLARDPAWVGGTLGILAVLHTWSRTLEYHPHAHLLVTAGGLSPDGTAWIRPAHPRFLMPAFALSQIFRAKLHAGLTRAGLGQDLDPAVWQRAWTVHIQQIGRGQHALRYLSRYVYRVALSNHSLERFQNQHVTFRYTHARTHKTRHLTLPVHPFIARFLQHVLPRGFSKVRSYGLLSPACRQQLERARQLLESHNAATHGTTVTAAAAPSPTSASSPSTPASFPTPCCPACQQPTLRFVQPLPRSRAPP
jgi:hypothetical protein